MVLETKKTTVAYRCPHCGAGVLSAVDMFRLSADMVKLKCSCGKSEMTMVYSRDGEDSKVRFTVPCILCPNPHNFTVSSKLFFGQDLFVLPCPYADINIAMMGDVNHVKFELSRTELELLDLLEKAGVDSFEALHGDDEQFLTDPQILEIVSFMIRELDEEGKIICKCPPDTDRNYEIELIAEGLKITCKDCGATKTVPTESLIAAHEFLNADSLELE